MHVSVMMMGFSATGCLQQIKDPELFTRFRSTLVSIRMTSTNLPYTFLLVLSILGGQNIEPNSTGAGWVDDYDVYGV